MKISRLGPAGSLALVVLAAGVVTACLEFPAETVSELASARLPDTLMALGDPTPGYRPAVRR
jgi:hypothetical protein